MMGQWDILFHEELHHTIIEGAIERHKPSGRSRNLYISQLKKDAGINAYVRFKNLADAHVK